MLIVTDVNQYYGGSHTLRGISLQAPKGQCTALLGRNAAYLRTTFLAPLTRAKRLRHTIPEQPNHPQQTYRATEAAE